MEPVNNNKFEVKPDITKRKNTVPSQNVYLNPALDLLVNEDPMCNNAMEIVPVKKRKRTKSCEIAAFENTALDLGISKAAVNEFLVRELNNVRNNLRAKSTVINDQSILPTPDTTGNTFNDSTDISEPIYANISSHLPQDTSSKGNIQLEVVEQSKPDNTNIDFGISGLEAKNNDLSSIMNISSITNIENNVTNNVFVNNTNSMNLSFIDRLALDSPNISNQSLYLDDDLNESNIMEIKTITIITKKRRIPIKNTNPFLDPNLNMETCGSTNNPFLDNLHPETEYNAEHLNVPTQALPCNLVPRQLFLDTNSTVSTQNESEVNIESNEYETIDNFRADSPIYENIDSETYNKQSKILGCDVSQFSAVDIMNLNKINQSNEAKKDIKHQLMKVKNKLSKKVFKSLKKTFKGDKVEKAGNPYEVPRRIKQKIEVPGIENPALRLDNSDEIEIEEVEDHEYETVKTLRNTQLNMNITPLRERNDSNSSQNKTFTPGKKVRFDSTLNQEKVITGNSFDYDIQSPGLDVKIDKYHDELENCINERKFLQQNM